MTLMTTDSNHRPRGDTATWAIDFAALRWRIRTVQGIQDVIYRNVPVLAWRAADLAFEQQSAVAVSHRLVCGRPFWWKTNCLSTKAAQSIDQSIMVIARDVFIV
jgi:hypothetical protein